MYREEDQLRNERKLIDCLLAHPNGLDIATITRELKSSIGIPIDVVMRCAFSKSLIRREDGLYFASPLGTSCPDTEAQIRSRIDIFNARFSRMPKSNAAKKAQAEADFKHLMESKSADLGAAPDQDKAQAQVRACPSLPELTGPAGCLKPDSNRGLVARILFEHRDKCLTSTNVRHHLPNMDVATLKRTLVDLSQPKFACTSADDMRSFLTRSGRGENSDFEWSGHFSSPFSGDRPSLGQALPGVFSSHVYKEQLHLLAELELIRSTTLTTVNKLAHTLDWSMNALTEIEARTKKVRELVGAQLPED